MRTFDGQFISFKVKYSSIPTKNGKLTVEGIKNYLINKGDQHKVQPKVISISQSTELGTVYTHEEIKKITDFAHANDLSGLFLPNLLLC